MFQKSYKILSTEKLNNTTFSFVISCPELAEESWCGRFVNVLCGEKTLRRPISISEIDKQNGTITIVFEVRGDGTKWMSERKAGDELDILGPLGNGFFPDKTKRGIFIGGGIGCPPMLGAAKEYGSDAEVILGFRSQENAILTDKFKSVAKRVEITTNDGTIGAKGFVTDVLKNMVQNGENAVVYACGPTPMLKSVAALCKEKNIKCYVSLEQRMACGIGACLCCAQKTRDEDGEHMKHVCKNGPVFDSEEVVF